MKLDNIGFYTLSETRARNVSWDSDLQRCELIVTDRCNFKCKYCRGFKKEFKGDLPLTDAIHTIDTWNEGYLHSVRFSGGEPTLYRDLQYLVSYTNRCTTIEHIAISTNGSASVWYYQALVDLGVNDFSISFDACCSLDANNMAGTDANFEHICDVIMTLSKVTYVTVGIVIDGRNIKTVEGTIKLAIDLGVSDVRVIPSAQYNLPFFVNSVTASRYPILNYRINRMNKGLHVRGLSDTDCRRCHLVKDDIAVLSEYHFPCIIYMRERGDPIGSVKGKSVEEIRSDRKEWFKSHDTHSDHICKNNCLDVCVEHNNRCEYYLTPTTEGA